MALDLDSLNKNKKSVIKFSDKKEKTLAPFERQTINSINNPSVLTLGIKGQTQGDESSGNSKHLDGAYPLMEAKKIPESPAKISERKWIKVEEKTENILKVNTRKTRRRRVEDIECTLGIQKISSVSFLSNPSKLDYIALRGDNKVMLNLIIENITDESPYWMVGTEELSRKSLMNESTLKTVIQRLKKKGFINVKRGVGERLITVNPSILSF